MMYNRYIPNGGGFTRITEEDDAPRSAPGPRQEREPAGPSAPFSPPPETEEREAPPAEKKAGGLGGILKGLKLDDLDTGDILLLLIILFLFLEGDDIELIITLGLMLLLGLD